MIPDRISDRAHMSPVLKRLSDDLERDWWKEFDRIGVKSEIFETSRTLDMCCYTWGFGRTEKDFRDIGLTSKKHFAKPSEEQRSYTNKPQDTRHYKDLTGYCAAFDLVLKKNIKGYWKHLWGGQEWEMELIRTVAKIGQRNGLRNLGEVYNWDHFHFELPMVRQPEVDCFGYVIMSSLAMHDEYYRGRPEASLAKLAEQIQGTRKVGNVRDSLEKAKKMGLIRSWEKVDHRDFEELKKENRPLIVSQKFRVGINNWNDLLPYILKGQGEPRHTIAVCPKRWKGRNEGLWCMNTQKEVYTYCISDPELIQAVYTYTI